jgi:hypothetical protein
MPQRERARAGEVDEERGNRQRPRQEERQKLEASADQVDLPGPVLEDPAALLTGPDAALPANAPRRAQAVRELQQQRGNTYVQQVVRRVQAERGSGRPLDGEIRGEMEQALGWGFGNVRVHRGASADELAGQLGAKAFAYGPDVFLRSGLPDLDSPEGKQLLAHELTHVVQQSQVTDRGEEPTAVPASALEAEARQAEEAALRGVPATVMLQVRQPQISRIDDDEDESAIRWMAPEAIFVENFTRTRPPEPIRASQIPAASVMRRFDQFRSHVDPFVAAYNFWTIPAALFWASMGRMQQLVEHWVVSPNPSALNDVDRQTLSLTGVSAETRAEVTAAAAEASRGPSVTEQLQRLSRSFYELEAAKSGLQRARALLIALRARKEREDLEEEVARINQRIQRISQIIQAVGNLALAIGTAGAGAAAGAGRASQAATSFGSGVTQPGAQATAGSALQWIISLGYQDRLQRLRTNIAALKNLIQSSEFDAARALVEEAENRLTAQNIALRESATALRSALEQRRNVYASLGTRIDTASAERARREGSSAEGFTRYQAIFQIAAAVREAATTGMAALQFTGAAGMINMVVATQAGRDLGPPGFSPTEPDIGQFVIGDALSRCIGFARWAQNHLPDLLLWAQDWTTVFSQIGRSGAQAPAVVQHETY